MCQTMQKARAAMIRQFDDDDEMFETHDEIFDIDILNAVVKDRCLYYRGLTHHYIRRNNIDIIAWLWSHKDDRTVFMAIRKELVYAYALSPHDIDTIYGKRPIDYEIGCNQNLPHETVVHIWRNYPSNKVHPNVAIPGMNVDIYAVNSEDPLITVGVFYRILLPALLHKSQYTKERSRFDPRLIIGITRMDVMATSYVVKWDRDAVLLGDADYINLDDITVADIDRLLVNHSIDALIGFPKIRGLKENVAAELKKHFDGYHNEIDWVTDFNIPLSLPDDPKAPVNYPYRAICANYLYWRDKEDNAADIFALIVMHCDMFIELR